MAAGGGTWAARNTMRSGISLDDRKNHRTIVLIDENGMRPVCAACRRLGPYTDAVPDVFICDACSRTAEEHLRALMETVPELRDHRLKRWRTGCDCERCRGRANRAV